MTPQLSVTHLFLLVSKEICSAGSPSVRIGVFSQLQTSESERSCVTCCSLGHAVDFGGAIEPEIRKTRFQDIKIVDSFRENHNLICKAHQLEILNVAGDAPKRSPINDFFDGREGQGTHTHGCKARLLKSRVFFYRRRHLAIKHFTAHVFKICTQGRNGVIISENITFF